MPKYRWRKDDIERVPEKAGVYTIRGLVDNYSGQSNNLRRRLKEHMREGSHGLLLPQDVTVTFVPQKTRRRKLERRRGGR
jgi:excinuclease UvrABC nuclease subunit